MVKILTVRQPWAWAMFIEDAALRKDIENRDWIYPRSLSRQRIGIHVAKGMTVEEYIEGSAFIRNVARAFSKRIDVPAMYDLPRGVIVGTVELAGCLSESGSPWFMGEYGFLLHEPRLLDTPIPARGQLGFWEYTGGLPL